MFSVGQKVETNDIFAGQQIRISKELGKNFPTYENGTITNIQRIVFRESYVPDMVIITLDSGFHHNADMFKEMV